MRRSAIMKDMPKACTRYLTEQQRLKAGHKKNDALLEGIISLLDVGTRITLADSLVAIKVDRFAKGNTAFKAASFKRFDIEIAKD